MADGWVKIHRKIRNDDLWQDKPFNKACAWIDLILRASITDSVAPKGDKVKRGQVVTSSRSLAEAWGWSRKKVLVFLNYLEAEGYIKIEGSTKGTTKGSKKGTTISLIKYGFYQDSGSTKGSTMVAKKGASYKKNKKESVSPTDITSPGEKKKNVSRGPDETRSVWEDYL